MSQRVEPCNKHPHSLSLLNALGRNEVWLFFLENIQSISKVACCQFCIQRRRPVFCLLEQQSLSLLNRHPLDIEAPFYELAYLQ